MDEREATSSQRISKVVNLNRKKKIIAIIAIILILVFLIVFLIAAAHNHSGDFTVSLDFRDRETGLSLFDNRAFENPTDRLSTPSLSDTGDMTVSDFEHISELDEVDGSHNGDNYFAYSFYLKNVGKNPINYSVSMVILETSKGVDEAVRVMLIEDTVAWGAAGNQRQRVIYAKPKPGGDSKEEDATFSFDSSAVVFSKNRENFGGGSVHKYTVVMYFEGTDLQCNDDILGGKIRMDMRFKVLEGED